MAGDANSYYCGGTNIWRLNAHFEDFVFNLDFFE